MSKKLFVVTATFDYVVVADDENDADAVGRGYVRDALGDMSRFDVQLDITPGWNASNWDTECIPYGGDGNTRTGDYIRESE